MGRHAATAGGKFRLWSTIPQMANPRRIAVGLDQNRLAMLLAVLHRHGNVQMNDQDVFANVVGGDKSK